LLNPLKRRARIIMGDDEAALVRLWREKRGEVAPEDLSDNLILVSTHERRSSSENSFPN
jgi:hypothetical protein